MSHRSVGADSMCSSGSREIASLVPAWSSAFEKSTDTAYGTDKWEHLHFRGVRLYVSICSGPPREIVLQFAVSTPECTWKVCIQHALVSSFSGCRQAEQHPVRMCKLAFWLCICRYYSLSLKEPKDSMVCRIFYDFHMLMYYVAFFKITVNV